MTPSEALQWADKNCQPETVERLRSRAAVAALAAEVRRMRGCIECLRGALKSAAGRAYEVTEFRLGDDCMEWAGDMEPPLMGSNVELTGAAAALLPQRPATEGSEVERRVGPLEAAP